VFDLTDHAIEFASTCYSSYLVSIATGDHWSTAVEDHLGTAPPPRVISDDPR
jgi:hypothetical protein